MKHEPRSRAGGLFARFFRTAGCAGVLLSAITAAHAQPPAPSAPDPLAVSMVYEAYWYSTHPGDMVEVERFATRRNMDAFARCMIEHRAQNTLRPNELWEFLTRSAALIRAKNMADKYYPPALRRRSAGPREGYAVHLSGGTYKPIVNSLQRINLSALAPNSLSLIATQAQVRALILEAGFSDPQVCLKPSRPRPQPRAEPSDDDAD